jgi:phosphoenolpyruvate synthase/pyruvate phosphate dikinase
MKNAEKLTDDEREVVEDSEKHNRMLSSRKRQHDYRVREKAKQMLKDLKLLAEKLPEKQQKQIFTPELFLPMVQAVVTQHKDVITEKEKFKFKKKVRYQRIYVANKRKLSLCSSLIDIGRDSGFDLIPSDIANLMVAGGRGEREIALVQNIGKFIE